MTRGHVFWLFGLSGAGKTTLATGLVGELRATGRHVLSLDGDELRGGLCRDLGYSEEARAENIRRVAEVARLAADQGGLVVAALITPLERLRQLAAGIVGRDRLALVWVDVPLAICQQRDPKGLYRRAAAGDLPPLTGVSAPFEPAVACDLRLGADTPEAMRAALRGFSRLRLGEKLPVTRTGTG